MNKPAAEYWWGKAALQGHGAAVQNLHMLHTKPEEGVSFFGTRSKGKRFVFVIDKSGSMNSQGRLAKAKRELNAGEGDDGGDSGKCRVGRALDRRA